MKMLTGAAVLAAFYAAPVLAQDKTTECGRQADMVMAVVSARQDGAEAQKAAMQVVQDLDDATKPYAAVVPAVVEWVYSLPKDQLGAAVGESWTAACLAQ